MRRMSFALTKEQILNQTKTVTRRNGWKNLKPGDLIQPVEKCMGLQKGEKQVLLGCPVKILNVSFEPIWQIDDEDLEKEGFPDMHDFEFIEMYCDANRCKGDTIVTRIEFEYTEPL